MKFLLVFSFMSVCLHVSIAKFLHVPTEIVAKFPVPTHGECHITDASCTQEGELVESFWSKLCYECVCLGKGNGMRCCTKSALPVVKSTMFCMVQLNMQTCSYTRTPIKSSGKSSKHNCCIKGYRTSVIQ